MTVVSFDGLSFSRLALPPKMQPSKLIPAYGMLGHSPLQIIVGSCLDDEVQKLVHMHVLCSSLKKGGGGGFLLALF
jgi:hypothetical protein